MKNIYTLLFACLCIQLSAQDFPYSLEYSDEPYAEFDNGTDAVSEIWDDPYSEIPIGFDFDYFGQNVSSFFLTGLGGALSTSSYYDYYSTQSYFIPYSSDIIDIGDVTGLHTSIISYKTTGIAPNRVCHIQWSDCAFYEEVSGFGTANNQVSFQVRLYEGSNDLAIHFGPNSIKNSDLVHEGNAGPTIGFMGNSDPYDYMYGDFWIVGGPTTAPEVELIDFDEYYYDLNSLDGNPANGTLYYFSSTIVSVDEHIRLDPQVSPNPTQDVFQMSFPSTLEEGQFDLVDMMGKIVLQGAIQPGVQSINIENLSSGVYMLRGQGDGYSFSERLVKN